MVTAASYHQNRIFEGNQVSAGHLDALDIVMPEQLSPGVTTQLAPAGPQSGVSWLTRWRHITVQTLTAQSVVRAEQTG